jgi:hypothetical protein
VCVQQKPKALHTHTYSITATALIWFLSQLVWLTTLHVKNFLCISVLSITHHYIGMVLHIYTCFTFILHIDFNNSKNKISNNVSPPQDMLTGMKLIFPDLIWHSCTCCEAPKPNDYITVTGEK